VVEVIAPTREVGRRRDAGEGTEVVYVMGLVEVATSQSQVRPLHPPPVLDEAQRPLETLNAAEELGCQPDLFVEDPDEAPLAEVGPPRDLRDLRPLGDLLELLQRAKPVPRGSSTPRSHNGQVRQSARRARWNSIALGMRLEERGFVPTDHVC
jgi:hypothetical protein